MKQQRMSTNGHECSFDCSVTKQGNKESVGGLECSPAGYGSVHKPDLMCK